MKHVALPFVIVSMLGIAKSQSLIGNGDFEAYGGGVPADWDVINDVVPTNVAGLDFSTTAVQLSLVGVDPSNGSYLAQPLSRSLESTFAAQVDFKLLTTGVDQAGGRSFDFRLRDTGGNPFISIRVADGGAEDGQLQYFKVSPNAWLQVSGQTELVNSTDEYRLTVIGDVSAGNLTYDVLLYNLTDDASAGGETGISLFHSPTPDADSIGEVRLERGRSNVDYVFDNVIVTDARPWITAVAFDDPNDELDLTVKGLFTGVDYHVRTSMTLSGFAALPGSDFTDTGNDGSEMIAVDADSATRLFALISTGTTE